MQAEADYIGQNLLYNVTVQVDVLASLNTGTGALASSGPFYFTAPNGFAPGFLSQHIQTGTDPLGGTADSTIQFNFGYSWDYTGSPSGSQFSFQSVTLHELTHSLGFSSLINSNGSGLNGSTTGDVYTTFDNLLRNSGNTKIINAGGVFNGATLSDLTSDVFFTGANAASRQLL